MRRIKYIQHNLLDWYRLNRRRLPWRGTRDPYKIWVSEIMLQQTQVRTVIPYYRRWIKRFPAFKALAAGNLDEVLKHWEGLGYYSRARNMLRCAQTVAAGLDGVLPQTPQELRKLPGIGEYTANAIASIAFGQDAAVVDGNVRRVLTRLFLLPEDQKTVKSAAERLLVRGRAGEFNQSLMELGAVVCLPRRPKCPKCPVRPDCRAFRSGRQNEVPGVLKKAGRRIVKRTAAIVVHGQKILMKKRPESGLLGGLWELPDGQICNDSARAVRNIGVFRHTYTHFKEEVSVTEATWTGEETPNPAPGCAWIHCRGLDQFALTGIARKVIRSWSESQKESSS